MLRRINRILLWDESVELILLSLKRKFKRKLIQKINVLLFKINMFEKYLMDTLSPLLFFTYFKIDYVLLFSRFSHRYHSAVRLKI